MASTGQARALGSDHPTGRPVIAMTVSPAARNAPSAASASGGDGAVRGQRVVDVGEDAADGAALVQRPVGQGPQGIHGLK
jgi:hypothetical protein